MTTKAKTNPLALPEGILDLVGQYGESIRAEHIDLTAQGRHKARLLTAELYAEIGAALRTGQLATPGMDERLRVAFNPDLDFDPSKAAAFAELRQREIAQLNGTDGPWGERVEVEIVGHLPGHVEVQSDPDRHGQTDKVGHTGCPDWLRDIPVGTRVFVHVLWEQDWDGNAHPVFMDWEQPTPELDAEVAEMFGENHQVKPGVIVSAIPTTVTEYKHDGEGWQVTTSPAEPVQTTCYACFGEAHPDCDICLGRGTVAAIHPAHPDNHGDHSTCDPEFCAERAARDEVGPEMTAALLDPTPLNIAKALIAYGASESAAAVAAEHAAPVRVSGERVADKRCEEIGRALNDHQGNDPFHAIIRNLPELVDGSQRWDGGWIWGFELVDGARFRRPTLREITAAYGAMWTWQR